MTNSLADDIAFARSLAEEGAVSPSLSGRFAVMWGVLVTAALLTHWGVMAGHVPLPPEMIGLIWFVMGITGGIGGAVLGAGLKDKAGQSTAGNQAERAAWPVVAVTLFVIAIALMVSVVFRNQPTILFDMLIVMAFGFYAVMTSVSARLFREPRNYWRAGVSLAVATLSAVMIGAPVIYLIAAAGVVVTQVLPGIAALRAEPASIV